MFVECFSTSPKNRSVFFFGFSLLALGCAPGLSATSSKVLAPKQVEIGALFALEYAAHPTFAYWGMDDRVPQTFSVQKIPTFNGNLRLGLGYRTEFHLLASTLIIPTRIGLKFALLQPKEAGGLGLALDTNVSGPMAESNEKDNVAGVQLDGGLVAGLFTANSDGPHVEFVANVYGGRQFAFLAFPYLRAGGGIRLCVASEVCLEPEYSHMFHPTLDGHDVDSFGLSFVYHSLGPKSTKAPLVTPEP